MDWLAQRFTRSRAAFAVVVVALTALAAAGLPRIQYDEEPRSILKTGGKDFAQLEQFYKDFGADDNDVLVLVEGEDLFAPRSVAALRAFVRRARQVEGVQSVASILDMRRPGRVILPLMPPDDAPPERFALARSQALRHPMVIGQFLSPDTRVTEVAVRLGDAALPISTLEPAVRQLRALADEELESTGHKVWMAGHTAIRVETLGRLQPELLKSTALSALASLLIAAVVFRRAAPVAVSMIAPGLCVLWTMGAMGWCGEKINGVNNILPALMFTLAFADTMHLLVDIRHRRWLGQKPRTAAAGGIRHLGVACLLAALTTVAGFGSLALARTQGIQRFGIACGGGVILEYLVVISVVPLLASTWLGWGILPPPETAWRPSLGAAWTG